VVILKSELLFALNNDLNAADTGAILKESRKKGKGAWIGAYLYAPLIANRDSI
jgi:hypothetical protein